MAKKSVGIVELHIEKVVLGAAVVFLLVVVFKYLATNPNYVEFDGKQLYPAKIDLVVRDRAEDLALRMQRPDEVEGDKIDSPDWEGRLKDAFEKGPVAVNKLEPIQMAFVDWGRKTERVEFKQTTEARKGLALAKIIAPEAPTVRYIRTLAVPPQNPEETGDADEDKGGGDAEPLVEEDIDIVILESKFNRVEQQKLLEEEYKYDREFAKIVFAVVQVQRQEWLGAEWSEWEDVVTFCEPSPPPAPPLNVVGERMLSPEAEAAFKKYRDILTSARMQEQILTPQGPTRRGKGAREAPRAPRPSRSGSGPRLPGLDDLRSRDRDAVKANKPYQPRAAKPSRERTTKGDRERKKTKEEKELKFDSDEKAIKFITEKLAEAERALKAEKYEQARALAQQVLKAHDVRSVGRRNQIQRAEDIVKLGKGATREGPKGAPVAERGLELVRARDVTGSPGRTYRYQIRVGILNEYCLAADKLENPADATEAILYSKWSEPSEAVGIERDTYFYLVGRDTRRESLKVDVFKWYQDGWIKETFTVRPGEEVGEARDVQVTIAGKPYLETVDFATRSVAVDMAFDVVYEGVQARGEGYGLSQRKPQTHSLVYMDEDGELHEQFVLVDRADPRYKDLLSQTAVPRVKVQKKKDKESDVKRRKKGGIRSKYKQSSRRGGSYGRSRGGGSRGSRGSRSSGRSRGRTRR